MKRFALYLGLATPLVASCSIQEEDFKASQQNDVIYYASFEQPAEEGTRVYANEDLLLRWTADDRVSIFGKNTYNQQYKFLGETGDNSGGFSKVDGAEYVTGNPISHTVSVYPYQVSTKIAEDEVLTVTLPAEQHYAENTFGLGANTMVSVSEDNFLQYKNVGGYLMLKLYGEGVSVSSITLKGNNGEKLAGKATVTMPMDGTPTVVMANDAATKITLVCDTPVALGATAEESTQFWFVVPPVTFSKGFTVTVSGDGGVFEKSTDKTLTIERNNLSKMSPGAVALSQTKNVIYYTSTDGNVVNPNRTDVFGANILSNEYVDGVGIITFDGDVTSIGDWAFYNASLTSVTIPDSVTSIGNHAFMDCTSLTGITLPDSVTSIVEYAFVGCTSLTSITIPDSVTSIGPGVFCKCFSLESFSGKYASPDGLFLIDSGCVIAVAFGSFGGEITIPNGVTGIGASVFEGCTSLTGITLPDGLTNIGDCAFQWCTSLTDITIPDSVTSMGRQAFFACTSITSFIIPDGVTGIASSAFDSCTSLTSILIPDSVTSIGSGAFEGCFGLTGITIPDNVTSIGDHAFFACRSLTSILIPDRVTSIGNSAFEDCTSLTSITVLPATPPLGGWHMLSETNNAPIYVLAESVDAYRSAPYWSDYADRIQAIPSSSVPVPEAIDMGLSSGIKWASFNLGASKPEEYGDYYAWGEMAPYYSSQDPLTWKEGKEAGYGWASYKWCNGSNTSLTKYCNNSYYGYEGFTDTKVVLDPEDDAAHVILGGNWRMPTDAEWTELRDKCTWTWTTQNGVNGRLVTANNGNSIFLPVAGLWNGTNIGDVGSLGNYWSSSLCTGYPVYALGVIFDSNNVIIMYEDDRSYGFSVRPVCD